MKKTSETIKPLDKTIHFGSREATLSDIHNELLAPKETIQSIISYLDEEKERVNGILRILVDTVYDYRGDFSLERRNMIHAMIDETVTSSDK